MALLKIHLCSHHALVPVRRTLSSNGLDACEFVGCAKWGSNRTMMQDASGTTYWEYDAADRMTSEEQL